MKMSQFDGTCGFGIFEGLNPIIMDSEKKNKQHKKHSKNISEKAPYHAPLKILFDSIPPIEIQEGAFQKTQLLQKIAEESGYPCFTETDAFTLQQIKDGTYYLTPAASCKVAKSSAGKYLLLQQMSELSSLVEAGEDGNILAEAIVAYIYETYHMDVELYLVGDTYIPVPYDKTNGILENIQFPIHIYALTLYGEHLDLSQDDYRSFAENHLAETPGQTAKQKTEGEITGSIMEALLQTLLPEFEMDLKISVNNDENTLQVMHKTHTPKKSEANKAEMFQTNATISLVFTRLPLTPDLFHGKKEVTAKEILQYLGKKYPEYSAERTELRYDKKQNLILPILKSGKRGTDGQSYQLIDNEEYRLEASPIMDVLAFKGRPSDLGCVPGNVDFHLPKIPFSILKEILHFF